MDLNLDALANAIIEEYKQHTGDKKLVENFISSVGESGTYSDVYKLAKKAGLNLEQAIINQWTFEADEVYFGTMKELLKKTTGPMHDDIAKACHFIQDNMNKAAGVKLKSQLAQLNEYDLGDIAERMKNQGITKLSGELQTLGCKMVDDNQQANMELQTSVGFEIVVSRKYDSIGLRSGTKYAERCKICVGLEGTHQFRSTKEARKSGVFARHPGCGCIIDYTSKKTGRTDYNIQNYHKAKISEEMQTSEKLKSEKHRVANIKRSATMKQKWASRKEEVEHNLETLQKRGLYNQNRQIVFDKNQVKTVNRLTISKTHLAIDSKYGMYVSENSNLKLFGLRNIEKSIENSLQKLGLEAIDDFPAIFVLPVSEMGTGTFAAYNPVKNEMYLSELIGNKAETKKQQALMGFAKPNDPSSSTFHEFIHWKTAKEYRATGNKILKNNFKNYLQSINNNAKIILEQIGILNQEQATKISRYAGDMFSIGKYDETLTEYLVGRRQ